MRSILLVSSRGCLKMEVLCLLRTVFIADDVVSLWKDTFTVLSGLK